MGANCQNFRPATRQRRTPPEKREKMKKKQGRRLCTPTDNDGGDEKEVLLFPKRKDKENSAKRSDNPPIKIKMAKFRCANDKCDGHRYIRDDIPESKAKDFNYCMDCGSESMERVEIYECADCAKKIIVPFGQPPPKACECGHAKFNLT